MRLFVIPILLFCVFTYSDAECYFYHLRKSTSFFADVANDEGCREICMQYDFRPGKCVLNYCMCQAPKTKKPRKVHIYAPRKLFKAVMNCAEDCMIKDKRSGRFKDGYCTCDHEVYPHPLF